MDQEALVKTGQQLISALESLGVKVAGGTWLRRAADDQWQLIVATPNLETQGPLAVFSKIQEAVNELQKQGVQIPLSSIGAVRPSDPFVSYVNAHFPAQPSAPGYWNLEPSSDVASWSSAVSTGPISSLIVYPKRERVRR